MNNKQHAVAHWLACAQAQIMDKYCVYATAVVIKKNRVPPGLNHSWRGFKMAANVASNVKCPALCLLHQALCCWHVLIVIARKVL